MTSASGAPGSPSSEPDGSVEAATPYSVAVEQITSAEAARVIGLLDDSTLVTRAQSWLTAGIDSDALRALAADATTAGIRSALLAEVASDVGVHFATTGEARSLHALTVIDQMTKSGDLVADVMRFSNNYTDEVTGKLRGAFDRLFKRTR